MGGLGNDETYGGSGDDLLDENEGRNSPESEISETNILVGGDGKDLIMGSPGRDTIEGGSGDDLLSGLSYTYALQLGLQSGRAGAGPCR